MRYVKLFENYYDVNDDTICDLEDICQELKDDGFDVDIRNITNRVVLLSICKMEIVRVLVGNNWHNRSERSSFRFEGLVKETVLRIKDYLGDNFIHMECGLGNGKVFKKIDDNTKAKWIDIINIRIK